MKSKPLNENESYICTSYEALFQRAQIVSVAWLIKCQIIMWFHHEEKQGTDMKLLGIVVGSLVGIIVLCVIDRVFDHFVEVSKSLINGL